MPRVHSFDPLEDPRWPEFVSHHPNSSIFHTRGWLNSLKSTYRYEPIAFTTSGPNDGLRNAIVFCAIRSWLTGNRLVSLPFSDHCEPLVENADDLNELLLFIEDFKKRGGWKYAEIRPVSSALPANNDFHESATYCLHHLDLGPDLHDILHRFHKDGIQRKIRRAERENLEYETGHSEAQLQKLYGLLKVTRQRHHVPPQPIEWFRNVLKHVGEDARIHIASKDGAPVAGILTLRHPKTVVYKYGGSIAAMNNLGGMPFLFWKGIQDAKGSGASTFDLGRSDIDNPGLMTFKDHLAARRLTLTYWRCPEAKPSAETSKKLFALLPDAMQSGVGRLLYRHIG